MATAITKLHIYDGRYYAYINAGAQRSAEALLPIVARAFKVRSVVDFGAGQGAWLSVWQRLGVEDVSGIDGDYVNREALLIPADRFTAADLSGVVRLGRTFDLVQSLEVAEHLPRHAAETFVDNLVSHGKLVLFSAAAPGQGGEHHVNEQPYDYWRSLFEARGFAALDMVRPRLRNNSAVMPWYRYNTFVYVHRDRLATLPDEVRRTEIKTGDRIADISPPIYKMRKAVIRRIPIRASTLLAKLKKHWYSRVVAPHHS